MSTGQCCKLLFLMLVCATNSLAFGQQTGDRLALTFAYKATGTQADLADGYRKHLEWHSERNDPLLWYAWFVVEGERLGEFVDGAFDLSGADFDARVDPAGDAADATATFSPFATAQYRRVYRLRADLSTSTFLEDKTPSPLMQVVYYSITPGMQAEFEAAARTIRDSADSLPFTLYELLSGGQLPLYAMVVPLQGFSGFDVGAVSLEGVATKALTGESLRETMRKISSAATTSRAEVWQYRADLSLIPDL